MHSALLRLNRLGSQSTLPAFTKIEEITFLESDWTIYLADSGISQSSNSPYKSAYAYDKYFYCFPNIGVAHLENGTMIKGSSWPLKHRAHIIGIVGIRGTNLMLFAYRLQITQNGNQKILNSEVAIFQTLKHSSTQTLSTLVYFGDLHRVNFGSNFLSLSPENNLMLMGRSSSNHDRFDVMDLGDPLSLGCRRGINVYDHEESRIKCRQRDDSFKNCKRIQSFTLSCLECTSEARSQGYELIDTPTLSSPLKKSCLKPPTISCQHPKYLNPTGEECYDCNDLVGCSKCQHFTRSCLECSPGYGFNNINSTCYQCSEAAENCSFCGFYGKEKLCTQCSPGFFLKIVATNSSLTQCFGCPKNCKKCSNEQNCEECFDGFEKKIIDGKESCSPKNCGESEYFDFEERKCRECDGLRLIKRKEDGSKTCEPICPLGEFVNDKEKRTCGKCSELPQNGECGECELATGDCQSCLKGSIFIEGSKYCRKTCQAGEYWGGKTDNRCHSCSSENNID